ncbi:PLDc N-terminal domain-containing protein [Actinoplanes sp. TFC3]|uniref:PLDc N-terminal domain-containing protein n=1 Tax=Actinoplanes sp. TFC3 TaxID=1710355 RepID=UPI00191BCDB9|nr:PLD nuclease N-terminal domain-containing protein [Actinoplanes sp. TFC3]
MSTLYADAPLAASVDSRLLAAVVPLAVLSLAFVVYCLVDVYRTEVRYLPKWAWALICLASVPMGGIVYLIVGRDSK